ncbi:hypothetical protein Tco_0651443 [Tanacetum coccineum]|uniref:Uncharacterized protein n=1 Tax=Tanacetum coccineum TaxID=301880 RepID=A0ABQ4WUU8_9ASTR
MSAKDTIAVQRCGLSAKELNEFLSSYPIPSEYDVILPTSTQNHLTLLSCFSVALSFGSLAKQWPAINVAQKPAEIIADSRECLKAGVFIVHSGSVAARIKERKCKTRGGSSSLLDCFELKDANACYLKISTITPPAWKSHLDNQMDLELLDLHDRCYARQAVVDKAVKRRTREFLLVIEKMRGEANVIKARERSHEGCEDFEQMLKASMAS